MVSAHDHQTRGVARVAAAVAVVGFLATAILQMLLALGILPVSMAWGGRQPELTALLRVASVLAAVVLVVFALLIARRAGLWGTGPPSRSVRACAWAIAVFLLLNTVGNFASTSGTEAAVFGPLSLVTGVACLLVAAGRTE